MFNKEIKVIREDGRIWSHVRKIWLHETPKEKVRQKYLCILINEYGYSVDQIAEEVPVVEHGSNKSWADFLIWRTPQDKVEKKKPLIVVECKVENIFVDQKVYTQGVSYSHYSGAQFFVTHSHRETKFFKVDHELMEPNFTEIENIPHAEATDNEIQELISRLKIFKENEFADILHKCHNIIRNREHLDPAAAFDEIAKILFVKTGVERRLREGRSSQDLFTASYLEEQKVIIDDPINALFNQTKMEYKVDQIFKTDEKINLRHNTVVAIVKELERYNLSDTSEDIKGIAFERFLGRTFRGEIGQFFTPRPVVEFIVRMLEPKEGEIICDPASGSGGFLIRSFEVVRQKILSDADREYQEFKRQLNNDKELSEAERARLLSERFEKIQSTLNPKLEGSRMWLLSNRYIYGTDANERMARTSKMNMIMHGDGHGGVYHHNGFLNVGGVFENRFDIILTNPPFGSNVEPTDIIMESDVNLPSGIEKVYIDRYGENYQKAAERIKAAQGQPIASLFNLAKKGVQKEKVGKVKTEILFLERSLELLKPGGRMGVVLPESIFNNPSLDYVRKFVEDRARILAVISLPQETFISSGAMVKTSLLFLRKFTEDEQTEYNLKKVEARRQIEEEYSREMGGKIDKIQDIISEAKINKDIELRKVTQKELREYTKLMEKKISEEARNLLKKRFSYPIFLYQAEKVGITATGESDENELFSDSPLKTGKTALEQYQKFCEDPTGFFV